MNINEVTGDLPLKRIALHYIRTAWDEALQDGLDSRILANATLYAALTDLVSTYGELAVSDMTQKLASRIKQGEFTDRGTCH